MRSLHLYLHRFLKSIWGRVFVSVCIFLISFEVLMNISSCFISHVNSSKISKALKGKRDLTIMCVGESTTYQSYPEQLQKILEKKFPAQTIRVLDLGRPGMNSTYILGEFKHNLEHFKPDIVIAMVGINDGGNSGFATPGSVLSGDDLWWNKFKTVKLLRLLFSGHFNRKTISSMKKNRPNKVNREKIKKMCARLRARIKTYPKIFSLQGSSLPTQERVVSHVNYQLNKDSNISIRTLKSVIKEHPACMQAYHDLVQQYVLQGTHAKAIDVYNMFYKQFGNQPLTFKDVACFYNAAIHTSDRDWAVQIMGRLIKATKCEIELYDKYSYALSCQPGLQTIFDFNIALVLEHPFEVLGYYQLATFYKMYKHYDQACELLYFLLDAFQEDNSGLISLSCFALTKCLALAGRDAEIPAVLNLVTQKYSVSFSSSYWGAQGVFALEQNDLKAAQKHFNKASYISSKTISTTTRSNYLELCAQALDHGCVFIAMQYPLRKIDVLKETLSEYAGKIMFLSNFECFKQAVLDYGHAALFYDQFGGDVGHTTKQGCWVLAENIADFLCKKSLLPFKENS